ncbi:MAG: hypothetical protein KY467_12495 [Gemmatimonadetes bacterium]|nr:hypothetical protein [Gemmatimonadota bacterium]
MRRSFPRFAFPAVAALALAACDGASPTGGADASMDRAQAQAAASAWDAVGAQVMDGFAGPSFSVSGGEAGPAHGTATMEFTRTRQCPMGGTATLQGTRVVQRDPATRSGSIQVTATRTDAACTMNARRGEGTLSITGAPSVALSASQTWTDGQPGTRVTTQKGSFSWQRSTGQSGTCTVDLTATFTPATHTYTLNGTFCNHAVSVTRTHAP